jgi:hypothetical protein
MAITQEQKERLEHHLQRAEKLHDIGELEAALQEFRRALKLATAKSETESIQASIKELKELIGYVSTMEDSKIPLSENLNELFKEHANRIYAVLIASAAVVLIGVSATAFSNLFSTSFDDPNPQASENLSEDKITLGVDNYKDNPDYGAHSGNTNSKLKIEDSDSRVTITLPDEFMAPYPEKYLQKDTPLREEALATSKELETLRRNQKVSVRGLSKDKKWVEVLSPTEKMGYLPFDSISDDRMRTAAEIDRAILAKMGNKYWEIELAGDRPPYAYFLHVNAPDAEQAGQGLISAYTAYAARQLLELLNLNAQIRLKRVEAEAAPPRFNSVSQTVSVDFRIFGITDNKREEVGHKTLSIRKDPQSQRFILRMPLEGV